MSLRIFHSADWHFGKMIGPLDRTHDFEAFLERFLALVEARRPQVLLLAGDIFDTSLPSNNAQKLYYTLIHRLQNTSIEAVVIAAGNHDSQRFLDAPRALLETMNCFIAGTRPEEQVFVLRDRDGNPRLGVAAVPYLREADVRKGGLDYSDADRATLFEQGVRAHYDHVYALLEEALAGANVPRVAMGHLFVVGSELRPGVMSAKDYGVANVGSLNAVSSRAFGDAWDYVALGHIHHAQAVEAPVPMRYAGAPLALSFNHRHYEHSLVELTFDAAGVMHTELLPIEQPRAFIHIEGDLAQIEAQLRETGKNHPSAYVEVHLTEGQAPVNLSEALAHLAQEVGVELIAVRNTQAMRRYQEADAQGIRLDDFTPEEVFKLYAQTLPMGSEEVARYEALLSQSVKQVLAGKSVEES